MAGPFFGPSSLQWQAWPCQCQRWCSPQSAGWCAVVDTALTHPDRHYREGAAELLLGDGFFREDSRPARDCSVLLAWHQATVSQRMEPLHWLDLMAGCGIRALRWGLEASQACCHPPQISVNDADGDRLPLLQHNLRPVAGACCSNRSAEQLLSHAHAKGQFYDLIDLDGFGQPGGLIQPALQTLAFDGILVLASTDGRSPTGHDRRGAIRHFGSSARAHPSSWEVALRQQLGLVARQAWMLGRGVQPLLSFSDGRTFRLAIRLTRTLQNRQEALLGLLARCDACGAQVNQPLLRLRDWPACHCPKGEGHWLISGPLWLGPLQDLELLAELRGSPVPLAQATRRLLDRLQADPGEPATVWSTAELARRSGQATPSLQALVMALRDAGHQAWSSGLMPGQVRTDANLPELLQTCARLQGEGL